jgi:hypothetical protein
MVHTNPSASPSDAKINANRENAKKSTGPRTAAGKAASSRNGLKHGLCAAKHILPGEDSDDFQLLLDDLYTRFHPVGQSEEKLVKRIAADQWRLDRVLPMEAGIFRDRFYDVAKKDEARQEQYEIKKRYASEDGKPEPAPPTPPAAEDLLARAFSADCEGPNAFAQLARYEAAIERSIDRSLRQLKAFQAARSAPQPPVESKNYEANPTAANDAGPNQHPAPRTRNPAPRTHNPQPGTPGTQHPAPSTQHP